MSSTSPVADRVAELRADITATELQIAELQAQRSKVPLGKGGSARRLAMHQQISSLVADVEDLNGVIRALQPALNAEQAYDKYVQRDANRRELYALAEQQLGHEQSMDAALDILAELFTKAGQIEWRIRQLANLHAMTGPSDFVADAIVGGLVARKVLEIDHLPDRFRHGTLMTSAIEPVADNARRLLQQLLNTWPQPPRGAVEPAQEAQEAILDSVPPQGTGSLPFAPLLNATTAPLGSMPDAAEPTYRQSEPEIEMVNHGDE